jgi:nicotinamide mononucleotide (NMN) deamidase PncC
MSRAALLAVALCALAVAGCAGDDGDSSSTAEWAGSFCTAAATWNDEIDQITSTVSASPTVESLRGAVDDLKAATDELQAFEDADAGGELETAFEDAPACKQLTQN